MSLQHEVRKLRKLAIDAYMASQINYRGHRTVTASETIYASDGSISSRAHTETGYILAGDHETGLKMVVEPPDADGNGGGKIVMFMDPDNDYFVDLEPWSDFYVNEFAKVRQFIDREFADFNAIPRDGDFAYEVDCIRRSISALAMDFHVMSTWNTTNGKAKGHSSEANDMPSEVLSHLNVIFATLMNSASLSGEALAPLKARYVTDLQTASRALYGLLYVYGGHIAAQQELWLRANQDITRIAVEAQEACRAVVNRHSHTFSWGDLLHVAGVALEGLGKLADALGIGPVGKGVIGVVGLGVKELEGTVSSDTVKSTETLGDYWEIEEMISTAVGDLGSAIANEERLIRDNVRQNLASIDQYKSQYDLTGEILKTEALASSGAHNVITWQPSAAGEVSTAMREAAPYYRNAAAPLDGTDLFSATKRPYGIGLAPNGPAPEMAELGATLRALLIALAAELEAGADNIDSVTDAILRQEDNNQVVLRVLQDQIDVDVNAHLDGDKSELDPLAGGGTTIPPLDLDRILNDGLTPSNSEMWRTNQ